MVTRIPVMDIQPRIEDGRYAVKAVENRPFEIRARIFREGTDKFGAAAILTDPQGNDGPRIPMRDCGDDDWKTTATAHRIGAWTYRIETWSDPYATWLNDAPIKIEAGRDVELTLEAGAQLLERSGIDDPAVKQEIELMRDQQAPVLERLAAGTSIVPLMATHPIRELIDSSEPYPLQVDRPRAMVGAWYEFFPRSEGAYRAEDGSTFGGTLETASIRLSDIAVMGFDVISLPPIHPIGLTRQKERNNSSTVPRNSPGSPWMIGSAAGGHYGVHPDLGSLDDFDAFVRTAADLDLEVALNLALQCSPHHPWISQHPEWFAAGVNGALGSAEGLLTGRDDAYPLNFDKDFDGLCNEIVQVIRFWASHGVRIFRVHRPDTKPLSAWQQILAEIRRTDPDVIFLAEASASSAMLHALAIVGFHQSHTNFSWCEHKTETGECLEKLASQTSHFLRPNFFVNTSDFIAQYLQSGDPAMFRARAALAATGSPSWGMYAGFELYEHEAAGASSTEYAQSEEWAYKFRDWDRSDSLAPYITALNEIRRRHPALQQLKDLHVHTTDDADTLCFSKTANGDRVLVVIDLYPGIDKVVRVSLNLPSLGLDWGTPTSLVDVLTDSEVDPDAVCLTARHPAVICTIAS